MSLDLYKKAVEAGLVAVVDFIDLSSVRGSSRRYKDYCRDEYPSSYFKAVDEKPIKNDVIIQEDE